ncbi:MAG: serine/threonine-protein kinase [Acidiphilium sp.]|nr:serine/threonine-protein kinase [Acidiphilium sp.]MDD4936618.1 serine/threonine-protein kinase [Acidiphilium sp.]
MAETELTTLGKYDIIRTLGRGAMGIVYEGFDPIIARRVAIKTVRLDRVDDSESAEDLLRFKREAQAAGRLTHPNIVGVYDYGETDALAYIVMEFVEGDTLKSLLDRGERFTPAHAVSMMESLLAGLAYSHEHGVIHRDIKPANVMITSDGRIKLADFGVARIESSSLTQAGTMIGTPSYMSPEQFMGQTIDRRTDIYSSGVLLYQLLTGEKPFEGSVTAIMHKVLSVEPPVPSALSVSVTPALDSVVRRAMAKRPEDRFATARDFAASLRTAETAIDADATRVAPMAHPPAQTAVPVSPATGTWRGKAAMIGGSVGALLVAGFVGLALLGGRSHHGIVTAPKPPGVTAPKPQIAAAPTPSLTVVRAQLAKAISPVGCTLVDGTVTAEGATLTGLVGDSERSTLVQAAAGAISPLPVAPRLHGFSGPYCDLIDAVRPFAPVFAPDTDRLGLHLAGDVTRLATGQRIVVTLGLPAFAAYVEVDYISSSGAIYRLYPNPTMPAARLAAGSTLVLGKRPAPAWAVGAPYGRDMILAIASSAPIDTMPKSQSGTVATFLPALKSTLAALTASGANITTAAILVDTVKK